MTELRRSRRAPARGGSSAITRGIVSRSLAWAASAIERLAQIADVSVNPDSSRAIPKRSLIAAVRRHDVLFSLLQDRIDRDVLAANPKLKAVTSMAITPCDIDVAEAIARRIPVTLLPPIVAEATADIAFGLMLAVARRLLEGDRLVRAGIFPGGQSNHLAGAWVFGKVLGLVGGGGRIGRAVARRARGFAMRVLYWAPRRKARSEENEAGLEYVPFDELLGQSDFVSLHPPLNEQTRHMIGERELSLMKSTALLVRTSVRYPLSVPSPRGSEGSPYVSTWGRSNAWATFWAS